MNKKKEICNLVGHYLYPLTTYLFFYLLLYLVISQIFPQI